MASACTPSARAAATVSFGLIGLADVGQRDVGAFAREPLDDGGADAAAAAGHQRPLVLELMRHMFLSMGIAEAHPRRSDGFRSSRRSSARIAMFPLTSGWAGTM